MSTEFDKMVEKKYTEDLIAIIGKKDEYRAELVQAAEEELKKRTEEQTPQTIIKETIQINPNRIETPPGFYIAAVLMFLSIPIWIFFALGQAGMATFTGDKSWGLYAIWNLFFVAASIVIGIGILKVKEWGYNWGFGTAVLNIFVFGYFYAKDSESQFLLFLLLIEIIIAISLYINRNIFVAQNQPDKPLNIEAPQNYKEPEINQAEQENTNYTQKLVALNEMIKKEKGSLFGDNMKQEIINHLTSLCDSSQNADYLLSAYSQLYNSDLVNDINELTSSYDGKKQYLKPLIELEIIEPDHPHARINK